MNDCCNNSQNCFSNCISDLFCNGNFILILLLLLLLFCFCGNCNC